MIERVCYCIEHSSSQPHLMKQFHLADSDLSITEERRDATQQLLDFIPVHCFQPQEVETTIKMGGHVVVVVYLAQQPPVGHDLIYEVSRSHTTTHHSR